MSFKTIEFDSNRQIVYDLLTRSKKFHCPVGSTLDLDITDTYAQINKMKRSGKSVSFVAFLVKASSLVIEKNPILNRHIFHGLFSKKVVQFEDIVCTTVIEKKDTNRNSFLLPLNIKNPQTLSLVEINDLIKDLKSKPIEQCEQMKSFNKIRKMPLWLIKLFSFKVRSDPKFYIKHFGTYGLSSLMTVNSPAVSANSLCNTGSAFIPGSINDKVVVKNNEMQTRKILTIYLMFDHYLLDGLQMQKAIKDFKVIVERADFLS
jgi:pyruvate/2-oxoglutarate dehydrogenase complex dihydrolipoamide acyltransferase (E2) component